MSSRNFLCAIFAALTISGNALAAVSGAPAFSSQIWAKAEQRFLLTNSGYQTLLKECIDNMAALEQWRYAQFDTPEINELTARLLKSIERENELSALSPTPTRELKRQRMISTDIRREITSFLTISEKKDEFQNLSAAVDNSTERLFRKAKAILSSLEDIDASRALRMITATNAVAIPQFLKQRNENSKISPIPLDDAASFAEYETSLLLKEPGYSLLKSRCDTAFSILTQWQELQLAATPEGKNVLDEFTNATNALATASGLKSASDEQVMSARARVESAAAELRRVQYFTFRDDKQNKILTDSYYQARVKALKKAVEILSTQENDAKAKALAEKITLSLKNNGEELSGHLISLNNSTAPVTTVTPLENWEKKTFANNTEYLALKNNYYQARSALKKYQQEQLSSYAEGAVLLEEIADSENSLKKLRDADATPAEINAATEKRNVLVQALSIVYNENIAKDPANKNLQYKVVEARRILREYTVEGLKKSTDPEATVILNSIMKENAK